MKKIVALVLALVLALSLATVAFGAEETYFAAAADSKVKLASTDKLTVSLAKVKDAGEKNVDVYTVKCAVNGHEYSLGLFALATEADYDCVFVKGEEVTYLKNTVKGTYTGEAKLAKVVAKADAKCGDMYAAEGVTLYDYDGKIMKAADSWNLFTAMDTSIKQHAQDKFENIVFTKADWQNAIVGFFTDGDDDLVAAGFDGAKYLKAANWYGANLNDVRTALINTVWGICQYAKTNYGSEPKWEPQTIKDVYNLVWDTLYKDGGILDNTNAIAYDKNQFLVPDSLRELLMGLAADTIENIKEDVVDNVMKHVKAELNLPTWGGYENNDTDEAFYGESIELNLAREVLKQAHTIKAVALVDGKLITLADAVEGTDYTVVAHEYDVTVEDGKVTKVACSECGAEFNFVVGTKEDAEKALGEDFTDITNTFMSSFSSRFLGKHDVSFDWATMAFDAEWAKGTGYYWNLLNADQRAMVEVLKTNHLYVGTAKAVKSADTFDAGIALYAGLALMSVTGSAVVIGKKKEF